MEVSQLELLELVVGATTSLAGGFSSSGRAGSPGRIPT
jgi:hypothetical protein